MLGRRTIAILRTCWVLEGRICAYTSLVEVGLRCGGCVSAKAIAHAQLTGGAACCVFSLRDSGKVAGCRLRQSQVTGLVEALNHRELSVVEGPGVESRTSC